MAAGAGVAACWCMELEIPSEVLAAIPEKARDRACVCASCARGEGARASAGGAESAGEPRPLRTLGR